MKRLFLVLSCQTYIHTTDTHIDRVDLTRRLDAINTWVSDALNAGCEVIFFVGGSEKQWYDEDARTLYLTEDDRYENSELSALFLKAKAAFKWVYENRDFDMLYLCDDDVYVNMEQFLKIEMTHDFMSTDRQGGGGYFFNKKSVETIINYENTLHSVGDYAIFDAILNDPTLTRNTSFQYSTPFYFPAELFATIHYTTGKRSYFLHNTFRYFNDNGYTNRKIILGFPLDVGKSYDIISYESAYRRKTRRFYDFTVDPNNWEYHGAYGRGDVSIHRILHFWPYAENATKFFVINFNVLLRDYIGHPSFYENLDYIIKNCEKSLIDKDNILLCSDKIETMEGWVLDNSVKETLKLNFEALNDYNFYKKIK